MVVTAVSIVAPHAPLNLELKQQTEENETTEFNYIE